MTRFLASLICLSVKMREKSSDLRKSFPLLKKHRKDQVRSKKSRDLGKG